nr:lateral signaling target protein 2 [Hymenolepis microstoma]
MWARLGADEVFGAIYKFHQHSVRSQVEESKLLTVDSSTVYNNVESSRKKLGSSLLDLIKVCVAESLRHQRLFRLKYREDMHLPTFESSLIATANRLIDLSSNSSRSLTSVRPMAQNLLNTLAGVQTQVALIVEKQTKRCISSRMFKRRSSRRPNSSPSGFSFFEDALATDTDFSDDGFCATAVQSYSQTPKLSSSGHVTDGLDEQMKVLIELLIEIDHDLANLEFSLVSSINRNIRTEAEAESVQEVAVLFSETIEWALAVGLISRRQLSDRDPLLFVSLPRIAIFVGCLLLPNSPIGPNRLNSGTKPPFMFSESTRDLAYLTRQLPVLRADQLWRLVCWSSPFGLSEEETKCVDAATCANLSTTTDILLGDKRKLGIAPKTSSRLVFGWNTYGLHCIYKCISRVAGNLSANHPSEYRDILQMSMETNDPGISVDSDDNNGANSDDDLQPICPLDSIAQSCLRDGRIQNIRLADVFDWKRVVFASAQTKSSFANLFQRPGSDKEPKVVDSSSVSISREGSPLEIGIDALECLEVEDFALSNQGTGKDDSSQKINNIPTSEGKSQSLLAVLRSTMIEDTTPAPAPNPLYPLAPWQPDRFVSDGESDSDSYQEEDELIIETDTILAENRRWKSGAPRVGRDCARCKARFVALIRRRHHCRSEMAPVASLFPLFYGQPPMGVSVVRVCLDCAEFVRSGLAEALDQAVIDF